MDPNRTSPKVPNRHQKRPLVSCTWHVPFGNNGFHDLHNGQGGFAQWASGFCTMGPGHVEFEQWLG